MEKMLIAGVMGQDCRGFLPMCLESLKTADRIIYIDGGSVDGSADYAKSRDCVVIENNYDQDDPKMNGHQRNIFLSYLKEHYPEDWCIFVDADEVVEDLGKIKEFIQNNEPGIYSVRMRHLIGDLGHEDSTQEKHYVLNRLFKVDCAGEYPEVEHPVLQPKTPLETQCQIPKVLYQKTDTTTIWHLSYIPNMWELKKKYENHLKKSNMHTPEYLFDWYRSHLFGTYPRKVFPVDELPRVILDNFGIDKDELYFQLRRNLDVKHFIDAIYLRDWLFAQGEEYPNVIDFGCGVGLRVWAMNKVGLEAFGNEISEYAVKNSLYPGRIVWGDITKGANTKESNTAGEFSLSLAYDVLEHLKYEDLKKGIDTLINSTKKYILVSVPFKGTPNCDADKTHIIKEDKEWWIKQFTDKGLKLIKTPDHFLYKEQIMIFEKNET